MATVRVRGSRYSQPLAGSGIRVLFASISNARVRKSVRSDQTVASHKRGGKLRNLSKHARKDCAIGVQEAENLDRVRVEVGALLDDDVPRVGEQALNGR